MWRQLKSDKVSQQSTECVERGERWAPEGTHIQIKRSQQEQIDWRRQHPHARPAPIRTLESDAKIQVQAPPPSSAL